MEPRDKSPSLKSQPKKKGVMLVVDRPVTDRTREGYFGERRVSVAESIRRQSWFDQARRISVAPRRRGMLLHEVRFPATFNGLYCARFSPGGDLLATSFGVGAIQRLAASLVSILFVREQSIELTAEQPTGCSVRGNLNPTSSRHRAWCLPAGKERSGWIAGSSRHIGPPNHWLADTTVLAEFLCKAAFVPLTDFKENPPPPPATSVALGSPDPLELFSEDGICLVDGDWSMDYWDPYGLDAGLRDHVAPTEGLSKCMRTLSLERAEVRGPVPSHLLEDIGALHGATIVLTLPSVFSPQNPTDASENLLPDVWAGVPPPSKGDGVRALAVVRQTGSAVFRNPWRRRQRQWDHLQHNNWDLVARRELIIQLETPESDRDAQTCLEEQINALLGRLQDQGVSAEDHVGLLLVNTDSSSRPVFVSFRGHMSVCDVKKFRDMLIEKAKANPFIEVCTIAGATMMVNRLGHLKENTIGIIPNGGYRCADQQSHVAVQWLCWEAHRRDVSNLHVGKDIQMVLEGSVVNDVPMWIHISPCGLANALVVLSPTAEDEEIEVRISICSPETGKLLGTLRSGLDQGLPIMSMRFHPVIKHKFYAASACGNVFLCDSSAGEFSKFVQEVPGLIPGASRFSEKSFQIIWEAVGLERVRLNVVWVNKGPLKYSSSGSGIKTEFNDWGLRCADHMTPSIRKKKNNEVNAVDVDRTGTLVATAGKDAVVRIYDSASSKLANALVVWSSTAEDGEIEFRISRKHEYRKPEISIRNEDAARFHHMRVYALRFHPNMTDILVTGSWDNSVKGELQEVIGTTLSRFGMSVSQLGALRP
uniref:(California timema) hypothetical protein n=1 Tax=Timema californicum TaxID=61474 RepID=A0A7R9JCS2_TIMCA|nr:unnamed protein product [Timema californicum]